jgi:hypothetical protein
MIALVLIRSLRGAAGRPLFQPGHVHELAEIIDLVSTQKAADSQGQSPVVPVGCTSAGLGISAGRIQGSIEPIRHYALCQRNGLLTEKTARRLGSMIQHLRHPAESLEVLQGNQGIYHLLFHAIE